MLGSFTPVTFSRNINVLVMSKTSELMRPPTDHGDTTVSGVRGPGPIGWPSYQSSL